MELGSYLVLLRKETVENHLDVRDLEATKAISFRLTLERPSSTREVGVLTHDQS
jgi:hypothetical protein